MDNYPNLYQVDIRFSDGSKEHFEVLSNSAHLIHNYFDKIYALAEVYVRYILAGHERIEKDYPNAKRVGYPLGEC